MSLRKTDYQTDSKYMSLRYGENSHLDDASSAPHTSDSSVVQVPVELHAGESKESRYITRDSHP